MNWINTNYTKKAIKHLLMWICVWFFFYNFFSVGSTNERFILWFSSLLSIITLSAIYVFIDHLIPKYLLQKKHRSFALYTTYTLIFVLCAVLMTIVFGFAFFFNLEFQKMPTLTKNPSVIIVSVLLMIAVANVIKIVQYNFIALEEKKAIEAKFLKAQLKLKEEELNHLKSQIHPHFLFNTLNTLYGFSLRQSEQTPELILKLSALLDYILYQVDKETVFLKDELQHIHNYTDLEQIRFSDTLQVEFDIDDYSDDIRIPPMLLLPFVENAFKHGTVLNGALLVGISLKVGKSQLSFCVQNSHQKESKSNHKRGIGIQNLKKRLAFLYPDQFTLQIDEIENTYCTSLKIPIHHG